MVLRIHLLKLSELQLHFNIEFQGETRMEDRLGFYFKHSKLEIRTNHWDRICAVKFYEPKVNKKSRR